MTPGHPRPYRPAEGRKRFRAREEEATIATIREVAERLGVSIATVSRVLNEYPDVAPATREKVLAAIREQDFSPNPAARSLVTGRTATLGVVLETGAGHPDLQHPFFQEVLVGLKKAVGALGYDLLLFSRSAGNLSGAGDGHRYLTRIRYHHVDGVILMGADQADPGIAEVLRSGVPCMAVDLDVQGDRAGYVTSDNVGGAAMAVRHLHDLGHRRIALIGGPTETRPGADRLLGYRAELGRLGLPDRPEYVREGDFYPESGHAGMSSLLDLPDPPTAVFAAGDLMAAGAMQAIGDRGLGSPGDVAVVGFDDIQIAPLLHPALSTIRQDKHGLGTAAGTALVRLIEDPDRKAEVITLPVELVVRDSSRGRVDGGTER